MHQKNRMPMASAMMFLGLFAVMVALAIGKKTGAIDYDVAKRGVGIIMGLMLIGAGNLLPKFRLFDSPRRDPAQTLAAERFAGWVFVITGIAYVGTWALVGTSSVMLVSSIVALSAFALVAFDWLRRSMSNKPSTATQQATEATLVKRILLGMLLLSLGWGFAVFVVDHLWGDAVSQWVAVISAMVVGTLVSLGCMQLLAARPPLDN